VSRALVTGGAGFIGSHLVRRLVRQGFDVVVVDNLSWGRREHTAGLPGVTLIEGDVLDIERLLTDTHGITHVFHLAALISAFESLEKPDLYLRANVQGLLRVIELCRRLDGPRLVFTSTSGIYGNAQEFMKRESDLPSPATVYASTKLVGEQLLTMYRGRVGYEEVALRFFNVYGPGQSPKHPYANVTCRFSRAAALGEGVELFGDGKQSRDFVFVDDVVEAMMRVALGPVRQRLYNVGTGSEASIAGLLEAVQRLAGTRIDVAQREPWPNDIRRICADISQIRRDFEFEPRVALEDGLRQTIEFFRKVGKDY
jgi:UDP-glucose 4-epimerase